MFWLSVFCSLCWVILAVFALIMRDINWNTMYIFSSLLLAFLFGLDAYEIKKKDHSLKER